MAGQLVYEFVGLRAKMYSVKYEPHPDKTKKMNGVMKKAKGVKKYVIKKHIEHEDYKQCLFNSLKNYHVMNFIRSDKHQLYNMRQNKVSLSSYDDKRYIKEDGISTLAYGHYKIVDS